MVRNNDVLIRKDIWDMYNALEILASINKKKYKLLELARNELEHEYKDESMPTEFKKSLKRMRYCIIMSKYHIYKYNFSTAIKFNKKFNEEIRMIHDIFVDCAVHRLMMYNWEE